MNTKEIFDNAMKLRMGGKKEEYYASEKVLPNRYYMYYTLAKWEEYRGKMSPKDIKAYSNGGGKELEEKEDKKRKVWLPPKMAAYASSSRFVYDLLKDTEVVFEQKLPTSVPRSTSNMDAFYLDKNIFIEAKCHEFYSSPSPKYKIAYREFYNILASKTGFSYKPTNEKNDSSISFFMDGKPVEQFDIKQIISHILGIANACKNGVIIDGKKKLLPLDKGISLIYLLYNPCEVKDYLSDDEWDEIDSKYNKEICFVKDNVTFFKALFKISLEYVGYDSAKISDLFKSFEFKVANQFNIKEILDC